MLKNELINLLGDAWSTIVIFLTIVILLRLFYIKNTNKKFILHEEILLLLFITYILLLFELVTSRDVYTYGVNLTPFKEILRYKVGSVNFNKQVLGNIILFIPFGFFATYYTKINKFFSISFITLLVSTTIEVVQKYIGRSFDIDDIILNVVGGVIGFCIYIGLDAVKKRLPSFLKKDWFYAFLTILCIVVFVLYVMGLLS